MVKRIEESDQILENTVEKKRGKLDTLHSILDSLQEGEVGKQIASVTICQLQSEISELEPQSVNDQRSQFLRNFKYTLAFSQRKGGSIEP